MKEQPLLVLVHGAWHRAPMWDALIAQMPDVDAVTVQLPSSAPASDSRLGDLYADARAIRMLVDQLAEPVVVCAHSYGAAPATQGLTAAAWHETPTTYIVGTRDAGVPPTLSTRFSQRADKTVVLDAAHSAFYSRPVELASALRDELRSS
jgi:pimeloyl-ACP methyl ester carboxylesterase